MDPKADPAHRDPRESGGRAEPRIVVGLDGSPGDRTTLAWALAAAARRGSELGVVTVLSTDLSWAATTYALDVPTEEGVRADTEAHIRALLEEVRRDPQMAETFGSSAVPVRLRIPAGHPAAELIRESEDADLLVVGRRSRGPVRSALLGSVALHCATHARCPVVIVHPAPPGSTRHTVVAGVDGSACSTEALILAVEEAARCRADVDVVAVYTVVDYGLDLYRADLPSTEELRAGAEKTAQLQVEEVTGQLTGGENGTGPPGSALPDIRVATVEGTPADVLVERSRDAALLVVGSHGRGRLRGLLLGSIALHCAIFATCPVMIVRSSAAAEHIHPAPG